MSPKLRPITIFPLEFDGEVRRGERLGDSIVAAAKRSEVELQDGDVVVVTQKIVSKSEGRIAEVGLDDFAGRHKVVQDEARRIIRRRDNLMITETRHGFVCANAGVDSSNVESGFVTLLPVDSDASARKIRSRIKALSGTDVAVIVSDTFGRAWRTGQTNVAIGVAGMRPLKSYLGTEDTFGTTLHATNIAVADEMAGAAELVMGKAEGVPVAVVRHAGHRRGRGSAKELIRSPQDDLFR